MSGVTNSRPGWLYRRMTAFLGLIERWLHMTCRDFIRLASERSERPLKVGERVRQAMHRAICRLCRTQEQRMEQLRALAHDVGRRAADESQAELSPESLERMRRAMAEAARGAES